MSIVASRVRSRAGQLIAVAVTAVVLSGVGVGMAGVLESGLDAAVRAAATESAARVVVSSADAAEVEPSLGAAFSGAPVVVDDSGDSAVVSPDAARIGTGDLVALRDGVERLTDALVDSGVASRTAISGGLAAWAQELVDLSWRARLLALVPFTVVAVGGLVAARDVVRVLALSRVTELAVTRSRGASQRRIVRGELREILVAGAAGALIGGIIAALVTGTPVLLALALGAVVPLALGVVSIPVVLRAIPKDRSDEAAASSGRTRAAGVIGLVLLFAASGLSIWRLISTGSAADPAGIAAPALGLLAGAVLVLAAVGAAARLADLATTRWRTLGPSLAVRRVARRLPVLATVVLLVAIASASTVLAAAFAATGDRVAQNVRELRVGGDLLVSGWPAGQDPAALPLDGYSALLATPGQLGDDEPLILLATGERIAGSVRAVPGIVDPVALGEDIAVAAPGVPMPEGTTRLEVETATSDGVVLRLWIVEPSGRVRWVPLDGTPLESPVSAILALDADVSRAGGNVTARVTSIAATTPQGRVEVPVPTGWEPQFTVFPDFNPGSGSFGAPRFDTVAEGLGFELGRTLRDQVAVRLMPPGEAGHRIPAVVTETFAERNGLEVGATVDVRFAGTGRNLLATVAELVPALPVGGDSDAVLADLPAFADQQLRLSETLPDASELLIRSADAAAARADLPDGAVAIGLEPATADRMLGIARALLWFAAIGSVAVAAVGVAGVSAALVAERRRETRILAVLGELPARQARGQRLELALTTVLAALGGAGAGALLAAAVVPSFARAAAPGSGAIPTVTLAVDLPMAAVVFTGLALALAVVLLVHGIRVVRDAAETPGSGS